MIYVLVGNDIKKKSAYIKKLAKKDKPVLLSNSTLTKELINDYAENVSLFGDSPSIVIEDLINQKKVLFSSEELERMKESLTVFIFLEDKLLVVDEKKYKKYSIIENFIQKEIKPVVQNNVFEIADAFGQKDKIKTWVFYCQAIGKGVEPEAISGIIFWKIKTMLLNGSKNFSSDDLKKQSSEIVSLYHRSHRGECDFVVGLEQFILSSLSK